MPQDQAVAVEQWPARLHPPTRTEVEEVEQVVTAADPRVQRAVKWGRLTYSLESNWHHWLCAVAVSRRSTRLVLHKGALLEDRSGLVGSAIRHETDMLD